MSADFMDRLDQWRMEQRVAMSRSEAIRSLSELGMQQTRQCIPDVNQKILMDLLLQSLLDKEQRTIDPELLREALLGGHYWAFNILSPDVTNNDLDTNEEKEFVFSVLEMWSCLELSYDRLQSSERDFLKNEIGFRGFEDLKFPNFDLMTESKYFEISNFIVEKLKRFTRLTTTTHDPHEPMAIVYGRMLEAYAAEKKDMKGDVLSFVQMKRILQFYKRSKMRSLD